LGFHGPSAYLAGVGLFGAAFIIGGAALAPKLGVALLFSAVTAGTLAGALVMDHFGAFGNDAQRVTLLRVVGVLVVLGGVLIVRWR
ncbi:MAG: DMT family transporter, partial [Chloroflexi bacterium]|nr:DMT family transporter [Chloroflexota bacterium]